MNQHGYARHGAPAMPYSGGVVPLRRAICASNAAESLTLHWITTAAMTDTARQKRPTPGNPPHASISPPSAAPPNTPSWLLMVNNPVAVVCAFPASSSNNVGVTADDILASAAVPHARATVIHDDTCTVKTRTARRPLPQHDRANQVTRRGWSATRPPRMLPTMTPSPARARGSTVAAVGSW